VEDELDDAADHAADVQEEDCADGKDAEGLCPTSELILFGP
jgi:hypothetical protein